MVDGRIFLVNADIIIIGGGLSGLALADRLQQASADYVLLEARERFGGRILSTGIDGAAFDLGPAWFWPEQPRMAALIDRLRLDVFAQFSKGDGVAEDQLGGVHKGTGYASMAGSYRMEGGLGSLISRLATKLTAAAIHLNTKAISIAREGNAVVVVAECRGRSIVIRGKRVVLSLPPRVAEATIKFAPELPNEIRGALAALPTWMAGQAKILAVYDYPYWRESGLSGDAVSRIGPLVEIHDASPSKGGPFALFGFVGTPPEIRKRGHEAMKQAAKDQLARLFGDELREPRQMLVQDWSEDTLIATPADCLPLESHPAFDRPRVLNDLWNGRLRFSGTETATHFGGYLEGALEAAEDTAVRLSGEAI